MTWDKETEEYQRERLHALALALQRSVEVYVNFPSTLQAEAVREIMDQLDEALSGHEGARKDEEGEYIN